MCNCATLQKWICTHIIPRPVDFSMSKYTLLTPTDCWFKLCPHGVIFWPGHILNYNTMQLIPGCIRTVHQELLSACKPVITNENQTQVRITSENQSSISLSQGAYQTQKAMTMATSKRYPSIRSWCFLAFHQSYIARPKAGGYSWVKAKTGELRIPTQRIAAMTWNKME